MLDVKPTRKQLALLFGGVFVVFLLVSIAMPLTGDDLSWGVVKLSNYWHHGNFDNYDGRYVGNSLIIILSKMPWLLHLFYAATMGVLALISAHLLKSIKYSVLAITLIMLMPRIVFAQTIGWNAGFINYVFSALFPLGVLALAVREVLGHDDWHPQREGLLAVLLGLLAMLFSWLSEPVTLLNVISIAGFIVAAFMRGKQVKPHWWTALAGSLVGAALMFVNGGYHSTVTGSDPYRSLDLSFHALLANGRTVLSTAINSFELLAILFTLVAALLTATNWWHWNGWRKIAGILATLDLLIFSVVNAMVQHPESFSNVLLALYLLLTASVFAGILLLILATCPTDLVAIYELLAAIFLLIPYLAVHPFGPRCVFMTQLLLILLLLRLTHDYLKLPAKIDSLVILIAALGTLVWSAPTLNAIHRGNAIRNEALTYQAKHPNAKTTYFPEIPHSNWWWLGNTAQNNDAKLIRFYNLPQRAGILVPYAKWSGLRASTPAALIKAFEQLNLQNTK